MNKSSRQQLNPDLAFSRKGFSSNAITERLLIEIMNLRGSNSRSQIIRDAIFEYRKSTKGFYLDESPVMSVKRRELTEKQKFDLMGDEEYARDVIAAPILSDASGVKFVVMHWFGNTIQAQPLDGCKNWFSTRLDIVDNHHEMCKASPIEKEVKKPENIRLLKAQYGIIVSDEAISD